MFTSRFANSLLRTNNRHIIALGVPTIIIHICERFAFLRVIDKKRCARVFRIIPCFFSPFYRCVVPTVIISTSSVFTDNVCMFENVCASIFRCWFRFQFPTRIVHIYLWNWHFASTNTDAHTSNHTYEYSVTIDSLWTNRMCSNYKLFIGCIFFSHHCGTSMPKIHHQRNKTSINKTKAIKKSNEIDLNEAAGRKNHRLHRT